MSDIAEANLSPAPSALDRLAHSIARLVARHGFKRVASTADLPLAGLAVLLLTDDPQRFPEVLDAAVILPEALHSLGLTLSRLVADPGVSAALAPAYGAPRPPAVVCLRDGEYQGSLSGIRDWAEYQAELARLIQGPAQAKPIAIRIVQQGACA
ncbi:MAG: hypothetical protein N3C59_00755 [Azovibrio sp.]|nr:hypothetical protein [Azovibrio sp.]